MSGELLVLWLFLIALGALMWFYREKPVPQPVAKPEPTIVDVHRELASAMRRIVPTYRMIGAQHVAAIEAIAAWHDQEIARSNGAFGQSTRDIQARSAQRAVAPTTGGPNP